jgi:hypothetical protein
MKRWPSWLSYECWGSLVRNGGVGQFSVFQIRMYSLLRSSLYRGAALGGKKLAVLSFDFKGRGRGKSLTQVPVLAESI